MQKRILLKDLIPHGDVGAQIEDGVLKFTSKIRVGNYLDARASGLMLPEKVKLLFRMDVSVFEKLFAGIEYNLRNIRKKFK